MDKFVFFYHAIPPEAEAISLEELHIIVRDIWLKRHDEDLAQEKAVRRKGRPKTSKQMHLEEVILQEEEEYRTGFGGYLFRLYCLIPITALINYRGP